MTRPDSGLKHANPKPVETARKFKSAKAMVDSVKRLRELTLAKLNNDQKDYRKVAGKDNPAVTERIKDTKRRFDERIAKLESFYLRFVELIGGTSEAGGMDGAEPKTPALPAEAKPPDQAPALPNPTATTALTIRESVAIAPLLGVREYRAKHYLEVYSMQRLRELADVARREDVNASRLVDTDLMLWEDGQTDVALRVKDAISIVQFRNEMERIINREYKGRMSAQQKRKAQEGSYSNALTELWDKILRKHNGDEVKAAEEYAVASAELLTSSEGIAGRQSTYGFGIPQSVEIFILFNYDQEILAEFLHYFELNFNLGDDEGRRWRGGNGMEGMRTPFRPLMSRVKGTVVRTIQAFIEDNEYVLDISPRSRYFEAAAEGRDRARCRERRGDRKDSYDDEDQNTFLAQAELNRKPER